MIGSNCSLFGYSGCERKFGTAILEASQKGEDEWSSKWRKRIIIFVTKGCVANKTVREKTIKTYLRL